MRAMLILLGLGLVESSGNRTPPDQPPNTRPTHSEIASAVQPILDDIAVEFNMSFQLGYADGISHGSGWGFASGLDDRLEGTPLLPSTAIPGGSVTKTWTAVAVLQGVAQGKLQLKTLAHTLVDPVLKAQNQTTMLELWHGDSEVERVTVRDLLGHTSGFEDYDNDQLRFFTIANPTRDFTPFDFLAVANKTRTCRRVPCPPFYSSINFILLGLIAQDLSGRAAWEDFDQLSVISASRQHLYDQTVFPKLGPCSAYPVSHQYAVAEVEPGKTLPVPVFWDMIEYSCLNGWTTGNIASSARDLAMFFRDLFQSDSTHPLLPPALVAEMREWRNLTNDWTDGYADLGIWYGLALFRCGEFAHIVVPGTGPRENAILWGHPGSDYGSTSSPVCGWNDAYNFGICVLMNSAQGMNCSTEASTNLAERAGSIGSCLLYAKILHMHGGPWLDCYEYKPSATPYKSSTVGCAWEKDLPVCSGCQSTCAKCAPCGKNRRGSCEWCWTGFSPCLPFCENKGCFGQ